ncbi:Uncharacterised protein [Legionella quateirensis]|uniref:Uncharacterized protein n=1 Tax=Legionella quateirensis TaxID=45072 RepID=A0A378KR30_9GAMM|nr:Uncharacterised protein [Legionella quateirensis]
MHQPRENIYQISYYETPFNSTFELIHDDSNFNGFVTIN